MLDWTGDDLLSRILVGSNPSEGASLTQRIIVSYFHTRLKSNELDYRHDT